jgi:hypothetical protein
VMDAEELHIHTSAQGTLGVTSLNFLNFVCLNRTNMLHEQHDMSMIPISIKVSTLASPAEESAKSADGLIGRIFDSTKDLVNSKNLVIESEKRMSRLNETVEALCKLNEGYSTDE